MLSSLKWSSIEHRIMFLTAVLVFKMMRSDTPQYMSHWLVPVSHQYGTVQGYPPPHIHSPPQALDSEISYQHLFTHSQGKL